MAFHHHHHRRDDDDEPRYPPPGSRPPYSDPPPPPFPNVHHTHHEPSPYSDPPPPPFPNVHHTHHEPSPYSDPPPPPVPHGHHTHHHEPPPPSYVAYHSNFPPEPPAPNFGYSSGPAPPPPSVHHGHQPQSGIIHSHSHQSDSTSSNRPAVKVFCRANPNFSLAIRHGKVVLVPSDPYDLTQHWFKDEKYSTRVKDEEGAPCFALVNKATGQAMKHSVGESHPVQLISYNPEVLDESVLWTQSKEFKEGYRAMRMVNNVHLNVDAYHGDEYSGGVRDGTQIVLWKWKEGDNQLWKIVPY